MLYWAIKHVTCQGWRLLPTERRIPILLCVRWGRENTRSQGKGKYKFSWQMNSPSCLAECTKGHWGDYFCSTSDPWSWIGKKKECPFHWLQPLKDRSLYGCHVTPQSSPLDWIILQFNYCEQLFFKDDKVKQMELQLCKVLQYVYQ